MTVFKIPHNGAIRVSDILNGHLVQRVYYGYTKAEAVRKFRAEMRGGHS